MTALLEKDHQRALGSQIHIILKENVLMTDPPGKNAPTVAEFAQFKKNEDLRFDEVETAL